MDGGITLAALATVVFVIAVAAIFGAIIGEGLAVDVNKKQYENKVREAQDYFESFCADRAVGIVNGTYVVYVPLTQPINGNNCLAYSLGFNKRDLAATFTDEEERKKIVKILQTAEEYLDAAINSTRASSNQSGVDPRTTQAFKNYSDTIVGSGGKKPFVVGAQHNF